MEKRNLNWNYVPFKDLISWEHKSTIKSGDGKQSGKYKFFVCSNTDIKRCDTALINRKALIFGTGGKASVHYCSEPFSYSTDCVVAIQKDSNVNLKFLFYYFKQNNLSLLQKDFTGSGLQHTSKKKIGEILVPKITYEEQERIVARIEELISELDKAVETLKTTKQQLAVYRQAVYASVFDHGTLRPITDFFEISGGLTKNSKRHEFHTKMPYLRVANVYYNFLDLREIKQIGVTTNEIERTLLQKDDLLFVEGNGSKSQIGRVAIWDGSIKNCLHQNHLIKGRPMGGMLPKYALFYLISGYGRKQILDIASSTSGLYTLSTNKIKNLKIPYVDIVNQQKSLELIDARLSCCDQIEKTIEQSLQQAEAMRQSILKQAFEGKLI